MIAVGDPDTARVTVVLLHGMQMEASDLSPFADSLKLPARFLFPEGPEPSEPRGRAWWHTDMAERARSLARGPRDFAVEHPAGLPAARDRLAAILDGLPRDRPIVVGGFSQGGMLTIDLMMRAPRPVAGLVLLSASRIARDEWPEPRLAGLPVLVSHGRADDDLAFAAGERLRDELVAAGADVTWVPHDEGHTIPLVVWRALRKWLPRFY